MIYSLKEENINLVKNLTYELVKINSITNTMGEVEAALYIYIFLASLDYFKQNKENLILQELNDNLGRKNVIAILKGINFKNNNVVVLLSHFDTVDIEDYQNLKDFAFDVNELTSKIRELFLNAGVVKDSNKENANSDNKDLDEIISDIESERYLFGRGILDMKAGVAINLAIIKELTENIDSLNGIVIAIFVCDEETNSLGMLKTVDFLYHYKKKNNVNYVACIDTDYVVKTKKDNNIMVNSYYGSIGKILVGFYVKGIETHVGESYKGLNPLLILSKIISSFEMNKNIIDKKNKEVIPPTFIYAKDLKESYSVKTPSNAFAFLNILIFNNNIEKIISNIVKILKMILSPFVYKYKLQVLDYQEFNNLLKLKLKENYENIYSNLKERLYNEYKSLKIDERFYGLYLIRELNNYLDFNPRVVVFWVPPFYPAVFNKNKKIIRIFKKVLKAFDGEYKHNLKQFFPYISDLSFLAKIDNINYIKNNLIGFNEVYFLDFEKINYISMDVFDIGTLGNDAHKFTERIDAFYTFNILPNVVFTFIKKILEN